MSSNNIAISVENISKCYQMYNKPSDRLKQFFSKKDKKYYKEFWAVKDVSFSIKKGETVGIIGKNGSGKSTLLQMICGTLTPTAGNIISHGRIAALLELGAGFNIEFTGLENVFINAEILGISKKEMEKRIDDILDFSELGEKLYQPVKTYSSGMFARLAFSVAIHVDPDILIIDEALAVGDAKFVAKCMKKIKDIQSAGASILFVSHDVGSVRTLCDRVIWIDHGNKVSDGDVFPITAKYMEYMFKDDDPNSASEEKVDDILVPEGQLDARPVTHWGDRRGIILNAYLIDAIGNQMNVIYWGDDISIIIEAHLPQDLLRKNLMFSCSIKDLKGTDVLVLITREIDGLSYPSDRKFNIKFTLKNLLAEGKYLLAVAVEERSQVDCHYYEYIEGAAYFSILSNQKIFGVLDVPFTIDVVG